MEVQQTHAAFWLNLDSDGQSIEMSCDNEGNEVPEAWDADYANCVQLNERFYCGYYGMRAYCSGMQILARTCAAREIPIASVEDVVQLFQIAMQMGVMEEVAPETWAQAETAARLYIWDVASRTLTRYANGEIAELDPGVYFEGAPVRFADLALAPDDDHEYFVVLREKLNATGTYQLTSWPDVRGKFTWSGPNNWIIQTFGGGDPSEEILDFLEPIIRKILANCHY